MRVLAESCAEDSDVRVIPVSGWRVRTTLASIKVSSTKQSKYTLAHRAHLVTAAALRASDTRQGEVFRPETVFGTAITNLDRPLMQSREVPVADIFTEHELSLLALEALGATVQKLVTQLEQLKEQPASKLLERDACHEKT
jgi:hypothetical protein